MQVDGANNFLCANAITGVIRYLYTLSIFINNAADGYMYLPLWFFCTGVGYNCNGGVVSRDKPSLKRTLSVRGSVLPKKGYEVCMQT